MPAETDAELATRLARTAGALLVELRAELRRDGATDREVMDRGDATAHEFLAAELRRHRPDDGVLDEEGDDDTRRLTSDRVWIVDPLDGTREFGEAGRDDWAVHVALWNRDRLTAGAVALPALDRLFATDPPPTRPSSPTRPARMVISRRRVSRAATTVADALGCDTVRVGSAGAKAMAVVAGDADLYVHDGGLYQWDSAAPAAVAAAAGLHVSRIDGSPLVYNLPDPSLPDLLICRPDLADLVLDVLANDVATPRRPPHTAC